MIPNEVAPLWSIELQPAAGPDDHVAYLIHREPLGDRVELMRTMVVGGN